MTDPLRSVEGEVVGSESDRRPGEGEREVDDRRVLRPQIGVLGERLLGLLEGRLTETGGSQDEDPDCSAGGHRGAVAEPCPDLDGTVRKRDPDLGPGGHPGGVGGPLQERGPLRIVAGDLDGLLEVADGLDRRPEGLGSIGGGPERDPRLAREGVGLRAGWARLERGEVVGRQGARELLVADGLKEAGRREVARPALLHRERRVGDLADQGLDEPVLATFRRARIEVLMEQVRPHEHAQPGVELSGREARYGGKTGPCEGLAENRGVLDEGSLGRVEAVEPCRDEGVERVRDRELAERAGWFESAAFDRVQAAIGYEHPDRFDGVERNALGPPDDRSRGRLGQAFDEAIEEPAHRRRVEWREVERQEVPAARAPVRSTLEELRPGERDDEDRDVPAPLEQVIDEVERAGVGPVEILEHEGHERVGGHPLEVGPPGPEELAGTALRRIADAEERMERLCDPILLGRVRDEPVDRRRDLRPGRCRVVCLEQLGARANHLAEGPERDAVAVGRRTAFVPEVVLGDPIAVLAELPDEAALADAGLACDRDEPDPALAGCRVEEVLEQPQLRVVTDERRLKPVGPPRAAAPPDDADRPEGRDGGRLALEELIARGLVGDRAARRMLG